MSTETLQYLPEDIFELRDRSVIGIKQEGNESFYYDSGNVIDWDLDYVAIPKSINGVDIDSAGIKTQEQLKYELSFGDRIVIIPNGVKVIEGHSFDCSNDCTIALPPTIRKIRDRVVLLL